ncbi:2-dehydropantoate 2-reductase [Streptomyces kaniharaensis]|uniref:2-dehydropantoate 2-reductase n=1 Tax=Streptomyces kaniharaensis TaxID=212423 RepID=A0A6N7KVG4_9ACTN|nr:2-dehydropantoate 2-reductase [Streptomyces kaniharaensis]
MSPAAREACRTVLDPGASRPWTVAVLGPGGVGGLLAALLSRAGHRVICLAGETTADDLRRDGIRVRSAQFGEFTAHVEADTELREPVDLCLVTVKHTHLAAALERVPPAMTANGVVVPLLNGIEHPAELRRRFGAQCVAAGVVRVESTRVAPGSVEHGSPFTDIDLAGPPDRLAALADVLGSAGVKTRVSEDEPAVLWAKFAFLAPFALLTTRYELTIGEVRTERREELTALVEEAAAVARACGAPADPARTLAQYDAFPAEAKSSMQRDAEAGRPLELDAIGGALLRSAARHGVPVPLATRLVGELT